MFANSLMWQQVRQTNATFTNLWVSKMSYLWIVSINTFSSREWRSIAKQEEISPLGACSSSNNEKAKQQSLENVLERKNTFYWFALSIIVRSFLSSLLVLWKKIINFVGNVGNKNPANLISKFVRVMGLILTYKEAVFQSSVATCDCLQWPFIYLNKNCCVKESKNEARNFQLLNLNLILYSIRNSTYFLFTWRAT